MHQLWSEDFLLETELIRSLAELKIMMSRSKFWNGALHKWHHQLSLSQMLHTAVKEHVSVSSTHKDFQTVHEGKYDAYLLWSLAKKIQNPRSTAVCDYAVNAILFFYLCPPSKIDEIIYGVPKIQNNFMTFLGKHL